MPQGISGKRERRSNSVYYTLVLPTCKDMTKKLASFSNSVNLLWCRHNSCITNNPSGNVNGLPKISKNLHLYISQIDYIIGSLFR